jgi:hypothetical protein
MRPAARSSNNNNNNNVTFVARHNLAFVFDLVEIKQATGDIEVSRQF